jgi:tetratricopeptide (TPR) repeat protein
MTGTTMTTCPEPEIIGSFAEGKLSGEELQSTLAHLETCDSCVEAAGMVSAMLGTQPEVRSVPRRASWSWLAAAAVLVAVLGGTFYQRQQSAAGTHSVQSLAAAAPTDERTIEPRLSGFPFAPFSRKRGNPGEGEESSSKIKIEGAAAEVLADTKGNRTANAAHATGLAMLVLDHPSEAVQELEPAARDSKDAASWNDLAAALYVSAQTREGEANLPKALEATDKAIALSPHDAEAHFNRALILSRLGRRQDAAAEWRAYLAIDSTSGWAAEARSKLEATQVP